MSDWWGAPATDSQEGSGLSGFFTGERGSDFGERLGLVGEILSRIGSGQGLAGISGQIGAVNERGSKRRQRNKMTQMANRLADKIQENNPELADMIRSNPEYGLELVGKKMLYQEQSKWELENKKAMAPFEIQLAKEKAIAEGDIAKANKLAELEAKAAIDERERAGRLKAMGLDSGGDTGSIPTQPPAGAPTPAPVPAPAAGMSAGNGTEPPAPASSGIGTPPVVAPEAGGGAGVGAGEGTPPAPTIPPQYQTDPMSELQLSPNKRIAGLQLKLSREWGAPVSALDVQALMDSAYMGKEASTQIFQNIQKRYTDAKVERDKRAYEKWKTDEGRQYEEGKGRVNEATFRSGLPQIKPATGPIGPMPGDTAQPGQNPDDLAVLQGVGFDNPVKALGADMLGPAAARVLDAERANRDSSGVVGDLMKAAETHGTARKLEAGQRSVAAIVDPMLQDPQFTVTDKALLSAMKVAEPKDVGTLMSGLSETARKRFEFGTTEARLTKEHEDAQAELAFQRGITGRKTDAEVAQNRREQEKFDTEKATKEQGKQDFEATRELTAQNSVSQISSAIAEISNADFPTTGVIGSGLSWMGSSTSAGKVAGLLTSITGDQFLDQAQNMRVQGAAVGATGTSLGQIQLAEKAALEYRQANISQYYNDKKSLLHELKTIANMRLDILYGKGNGPFRIKVDGEDGITRVKANSPEGTVDWEDAIREAEDAADQQPAQSDIKIPDGFTPYKGGDGSIKAYKRLD